MASCNAAAVLEGAGAVNRRHHQKSVAKCVADGPHSLLNTLWAALAPHKFEINSMNSPQWAGQGRPQWQKLAQAEPPHQALAREDRSKSDGLFAVELCAAARNGALEGKFLWDASVGSRWENWREDGQQHPPYERF